VRGGGTVELCVQWIKNRERGRSSRESTWERRQWHLQESIAAWHVGRHNTAQARRRGGVRGRLTMHTVGCVLGSTAKRHRRGRGCGAHLWSKWGPDGEGDGEEKVDVVKGRGSSGAARCGERRHAATSRSGSLITDGSGFTTTARPRSAPRLLSPTPPLHRRQQRRKWGGIPERLGFGPPCGCEIYRRGQVPWTVRCTSRRVDASGGGAARERRRWIRGKRGRKGGVAADVWGWLDSDSSTGRS
jgi:hypothetical protein